MYNLLIVDDEKHYTDSLAETVPWVELGIGKVFKAYGAAQALDQLEQGIDILLTDIRMPKTTGLELIAEVKKRKPNIRCIVLTGYAEFQFAHEAIKLQAVDYLLKPVKDEQLFAAMHKVVQQLEGEREARRVQAVYRENLIRLKSNLLIGCLAESARSKYWTDKLIDYGIDIPHGGHVALCIIGLGDAFKRDLYSNSLMQFAAANILEELLRERYDVWWTAEEAEGNLIAVAYEASGTPPELDWLKLKMAQLKVEARKWLKVEVTDTFVGECLFPEELSRCYEQGKGFMLRPSSESKHAAGHEANALALLYEPPKLTQLLETEQWEGARTKVRALLSLLDSRNSSLTVSDLFFHLSNAFLYFAHQYGKSLRQLLCPGQLSYFRGKPILHAGQLESWALGIIARFEERFADQVHDQHDTLIVQTRRYIHNHLDQDLSITQLADNVYVHPNHLSKLFKQKTHITLSQYIYQQRIQKAADLLKNTDAKIYQVGAKVGYPNTNWFIKKFKEYYQLTPQEYREKFLRGKQSDE